MQYPNFNLEKKLFKQGYQFIAGVDEVGRGAWAGPIVAAGVIINFSTYLHVCRLLKRKKLKINDSKLLTEKMREKIYQELKKKIIWSIGIISHQEINRRGLTWANHQVMLKAINNLPRKPNYLLLDKIYGFRHKIPFKSIINGDRKIFSIALASIFAKVTRDNLMKKYHQKFPQYFFNKHKGYGTNLHLKMLKNCGISPIHRLNFNPIKKFS